MATYATFDDPRAATEYLRTRPYPVVVKENGLTDVSDGARVCASVCQGEDAIVAALARMREDFCVVIEERLEGQDVSLLALTDGADYVLLPPALDYKRASDGDEGMNCDGMGTVAPHPNVGAHLSAQINEIFDRIMQGFAAEKIHYTGFIYVGGMITADGLYVLEINSRLGDSEAQVVLPAVHSNFIDVCEQILDGHFAEVTLDIDELVRCCVIATQGSLAPGDPLAKPGWPFGEYEPGQQIRGIDRVDPAKATIFQAGTELDEHGMLVTTQGRVLHVVGRAASLKEAARNAYSQIIRITFAGMRYRSDIGSAGVPALR